MIPQLIRSLSTACRLLHLEDAHARALAAGEDAGPEMALDLVDEILAAVERLLPDAPRAAEDETEPRSARTRRLLARVRELAAQGWSDARIGEALDASTEAVRSLRRRYDVPSSVPAGGVSLATGWRERLAPLVDERLPVAEIAARMGWSVRSTQTRISNLRRERREG